jgi:protein-S-isoprenylcysteine O-methyltransferase
VYIGAVPHVLGLPWMLAAFLGAVLAFHASEVLLVAVFNRDQLSWASTLVSPAYAAMLGAALAEFAAELRFAPWLKAAPVALVGALLVVAGESVRKTAMFTAQRAFTHEIVRGPREGHHLVTAGIYRYVRHPGYLGWFWWAIGAQLLLGNVLTTALAAVLAWRFFARRIPEEEAILVTLFPDYPAYRARTPTWLPFIP